MSRLRRQMSYRASLSTWLVTSVCSRSEWTHSTVLYGSTTAGVVDQEALQTSAVIGQLTQAVQAQVDDFLTDGVVTTGEVVRGIFLTGDQLFRVEELTVRTGADFVNDGRLQVDEHGARHVLTSAGFGEEGVERVI